MTLTTLAALSLAGAMLAVETAPPAAKKLSLAEAEATGLRHQPTLEQALGQLEAAEGRVEQARAGYLPQLNASGTYQRTTANFVPRPGFVQMGVNVPPSAGWSAKTFNFGPLKPNKSVVGVWKLSAVKSGDYKVLYSIDAGLSGTAKAKTAAGTAPGGSFAVKIVTPPPNTIVTDSGEVVEIPAKKTAEKKQPKR